VKNIKYLPKEKGHFKCLRNLKFIVAFAKENPRHIDLVKTTTTTTKTTSLRTIWKTRMQ
jgi:hypothetical protein